MRVEVARTDELSEPGAQKLVEVNGRELAIFNVGNEYHAVVNYCIHQGGPLCEGELTGGYDVDSDGWMWKYDEHRKIIHCPWHNWRFDVTTGENVDDDSLAVPTYDVEVEDGTVYVSM